MLRDRAIRVVNVYNKKRDLKITLQFKELKKKKEQTKPKARIKKVIVNIRTDTNKIENRKMIEKRIKPSVNL